MTENPMTCDILFKIVPTSQRKNVWNRGRHKTSMGIQLGSGVAKSKRDWTDTFFCFMIGLREQLHHSPIRSIKDH